MQRRIAWNLKAHRAALGLTQEQLGELIGRSPKYIGFIEQGRRNLTLKALEQLSTDLRLDPTHLLQPVPVTAPPPRGRWPRPDPARGRPPSSPTDLSAATPADLSVSTLPDLSVSTPAGWTVSFASDAGDALTATLAGLAQQQLVISIGCRVGTVVDGVPVAALGGQVRCLHWDTGAGLPSDDLFTLSVDDIATIRVW